MAQSVKDLHLCKCLEELNKTAKLSSNTNLKTSAARIIINSSAKIFETAEKALNKDKDEETAYIYFFRYVDAISAAQKSRDYQKDKAFYDKMISPQKFKTAVETLESLSSSLQRRYKLKKDAEDHDARARDKEFNDALQNEKNRNIKKAEVDKVSSVDSVKTAAKLSSVNGIIKANGVENGVVGENGGITPHELKTLMEQKTKRILLVDCRDNQDFTNNHINHSCCICIPPPMLTQGMSANAILIALKEPHPESYMDWQKRDTFDYIILYDWNSSFDHRLPVLNILYDALTKWDPNCKNTKVLVVQGGMKSIYYAYPCLLTNPQTAAASSSTAKVNGSNHELGDLRMLESISYPDLDDSVASATRPRSSEPKESHVNNYNSTDVPNKPNSLDRNSNSFIHNPTNVHDVPKSGGIVPVDRSTKPVRGVTGKKTINGTTNVVAAPELTQPVEAVRSNEKTDVKVQEYSQALDSVIETTKDAINKEKEVTEFVSKHKSNLDEEMSIKLKEKELEAETYRKLADERSDQLIALKNQYLLHLREQKSKQSLPRIRTPREEEEVGNKEREMEKLYAEVDEMRKRRIEEQDKRKMEQAIAANMPAMDNGDNASRLPPIPQNNTTGQVQRVNGIGTPQLPAINNTIPPTTPPVSKPLIIPSTSSSSSSSSSFRPVSQDSSVVTRMKLKDESSEPPRSSALKRSHSHPNIAQSHDDDISESGTTTQPPRVNRGLKPSGPRTYPVEPAVTTPSRRFARNFEVVSSTEKSKTGLKNLGNTCYMNSIIQCLAHTNKLVDYLRREEYLKDWHPSRGITKGEATEEIAAAVKQMHSGHRAISLLDLKTTVGKYHRSFRGSEQQDSHEFITIMLDWLHEEMNRVPGKTPLQEQKNDGLTDEEASSRAWDDYKKSNDSKISELFCGQQKSCLTCGTCNRQSVTFEPFFILSVPIPSGGKKCDIQQCIDFYSTEEEVIGWNCVHCKKKVRATKKIDLWRLPPYLIIHLQRFYFDGYWKKRLTEVDFPVDHLNLNSKVLGKQSNSHTTTYDYQLYGVSNHYGSMDGGHYTAYCRHIGTSNWWKFDDQEVCGINPRDVPTPAAYILFYQNRNYC